MLCLTRLGCIGIVGSGVFLLPLPTVCVTFGEDVAVGPGPYEKPCGNPSRRSRQGLNTPFAVDNTRNRPKREQPPATTPPCFVVHVFVNLLTFVTNHQLEAKG